MTKCAWCPTLFSPRDNLHVHCSTRCRVAAWREKERGQDRPALRARALRSGNAADPRARNASSTVAALYVRSDGHYATAAGVDAWDIERDASRYEGPHPVVAHPPCGPWGAYRHTCTEQRADLAVRAVHQVRHHGGVLEHPSRSHLWAACELPVPGDGRDRWGGWSMLVRQSWWGHRAPKPTWIYIVGRVDVPELPPFVPDPGGRVQNMSRRQRELTPERFGRWLVDLARGCAPGVYRKAGYRPLVSPAQGALPLAATSA